MAKHRLFAQYLAYGLSQEDAYIKVGFSPKGASANAAKLLQRNHSSLLMRDGFLGERHKARAAEVQRIAAKEGRGLEALIDDLYRVKDGATQAEPVLDHQVIDAEQTAARALSVRNASAALRGLTGDRFVPEGVLIGIGPDGQCRTRWTRVSFERAHTSPSGHYRKRPAKPDIRESRRTTGRTDVTHLPDVSGVANVDRGRAFC
jgi:hypothetical protein